MLAKRIIPCLDVREGMVVKGVKFKNHEVLGPIREFAELYAGEGADELVFYDIAASADQKTVDLRWVEEVASYINIPFCVAGRINTLEKAKAVLESGADKISINSPALDRPELISEIAKRYGRQCVVVGVDSLLVDGQYQVFKYTGRTQTTKSASLLTEDWVRKADELGAGEFVLNCMDQDGVRSGYDILQLQKIRAVTSRPLIASGGAGSKEHFAEVFEKANVDGALAASVFHKKVIDMMDLKRFLADRDIPVRLD